MYKLMLLASGLFFSPVCLCQNDVGVLKMRIDSLLREEILNYSEIKAQINVSEKNIEVDKTLILNDSTQVIQFNFGKTEYKVRAVSCLRGSKVFLLSFGRSDYLIYFEKGYKGLTHLHRESPLTMAQEAIVADAVLPECYKIYTKQNDSFSIIRRIFFQPATGGEMVLAKNSKDGIFAVNTIFLENKMRFNARKKKIFLSSVSNNKRKEVINYKYPKIDVIPVNVIRKR